MAENYPEDEFDQLAAERNTRGAHRRPKTSRPWLIALVLVLILAPAVGVGVGKIVENTGGNPVVDMEKSTAAEPEKQAEPKEVEEPAAEPEPEPEPVPEPELAPAPEPDKAAQVMVFNGRGTNRFAAEKQSMLNRAGYSNVAADNYTGGANPAQSTVYYANPEQEATARDIAEKLGYQNVVQDAQRARNYDVVVVAR